MDGNLACKAVRQREGESGWRSSVRQSDRERERVDGNLACKTVRQKGRVDGNLACKTVRQREGESGWKPCL